MSFNENDEKIIYYSNIKTLYKNREMYKNEICSFLPVRKNNTP